MPDDAPDPASRASARLALFQGAFYLVSGVWPLVHLGSFERITGPKTDGWLVKTVGVLVNVIGAVLLVAGRRGQPSGELCAIAAGSATGLAGIDTYYVSRGRISRIYLLDAAAELLLVACWLRLRPPTTTMR